MTKYAINGKKIKIGYITYSIGEEVFKLLKSISMERDFYKREYKKLLKLGKGK